MYRDDEFEPSRGVAEYLEEQIRHEIDKRHLKVKDYVFHASYREHDVDAYRTAKERRHGYDKCDHKQLPRKQEHAERDQRGRTVAPVKPRRYEKEHERHIRRARNHYRTREDLAHNDALRGHGRHEKLVVEAPVSFGREHIARKRIDAVVDKKHEHGRDYSRGARIRRRPVIEKLDHGVEAVRLENSVSLFPQ